MGSAPGKLPMRRTATGPSLFRFARAETDGARKAVTSALTIFGAALYDGIQAWFVFRESWLQAYR
jgi:hypothetical protein